MFATTNSPTGMTSGTTVNNTLVGTSVVPTAYPSLGQVLMFDPGTLFETVLVQGFMSAVLNSKTTITSGDEAGTLLGVVSGTMIGPAEVTSGSLTVLMGGKPAATQLSTYNTNGSPVGNAVASQTGASCTNVTIAS